MKAVFNIACLLALSALMPLAASAHSPSAAGIASPVDSALVETACYDDCYEHSRWRSHNRQGSDGGNWHDRWRSHYRWGSYGSYWHSRSYSHYRIGSYRRLWRPCDPCGYED